MEVEQQQAGPDAPGLQAEAGGGRGPPIKYGPASEEETRSKRGKILECLRNPTPANLGDKLADLLSIEQPDLVRGKAQKLVERVSVEKGIRSAGPSKPEWKFEISNEKAGVTSLGNSVPTAVLKLCQLTTKMLEGKMPNGEIDLTNISEEEVPAGPGNAVGGEGSKDAGGEGAGDQRAGHTVAAGPPAAKRKILHGLGGEEGGEANADAAGTSAGGKQGGRGAPAKKQRTTFNKKALEAASKVAAEVVPAFKNAAAERVAAAEVPTASLAAQAAHSLLNPPAAPALEGLEQLREDMERHGRLLLASAAALVGSAYAMAAAASEQVHADRAQHAKCLANLRKTHQQELDDAKAELVNANASVAALEDKCKDKSKYVATLKETLAAILQERAQPVNQELAPQVPEAVQPAPAPQPEAVQPAPAPQPEAVQPAPAPAPQPVAQLEPVNGNGGGFLGGLFGGLLG